VSDLRVLPDRAAAVQELCTLIVERQPRSLVLTGGTTAGDAYRLLASERWRARLPWPQMTLLFGDERRVPPSSEDSNFRLAEQTLLRDVRPHRVERMRGEAADPEAEADRYGALLPARLELTLLGMGADGHCASLFPGEPSLRERERLCVPSRGHYAPEERLTLTLPALNRSRVVAFLVVGEAKADALAAVLRGDTACPAALVAPSDGEVVFVVDQAAASGL
jgi:6-phosphogluconolactonase